MRKNFIRAAAGLAALGLLAGTSAALACPKAVVVEDTESWVPMNDLGPSVEAKISDPQIECTMEEGKAVAKLRFRMTGKSASAGKVDLPYFVAVAYMQSAEPTLISKEIVTRTVNFPAGNQDMSAEEEMTDIEIPLKPMVGSRDYHVLVGFQLKPEQLEKRRDSSGGLFGFVRGLF
ncbi:MAG TPA: hypothetical protein DCL54_16080 [Alphaproteobacteria bacterium]|nr:hypothetical protein [Alphaproteobacteria bacterium]HAJ48091.1 hypothetical protein [Alphaproteobacteria bacterium]